MGILDQVHLYADDELFCLASRFMIGNEYGVYHEGNVNTEGDALQGPQGRLEFQPEAADTIESLLRALPHDGPGLPLKSVLQSTTKYDIAVAQRLCDIGILV